MKCSNCDEKEEGLPKIVMIMLFGLLIFFATQLFIKGPDMDFLLIMKLFILWIITSIVIIAIKAYKKQQKKQDQGVVQR